MKIIKMSGVATAALPKTVGTVSGTKRHESAECWKHDRVDCGLERYSSRKRAEHGHCKAYVGNTRFHLFDLVLYLLHL